MAWIVIAGVVSILLVCCVGPASAGVEWSDITGMTGRYSTIYFDYDGSKFYCMNDWYADSADAESLAGLLATEYNSFPFQLGSDQYEVRIYGDQTTEILKNGVVANDSLPGFCGQVGWGPSPTCDVYHVKWEWCITVEPITITKMSPCDPAGPVTTTIPPPCTLPCNNAKSIFAHIIDGAFTESGLPAGAPPVPDRAYVAPVTDPYWEHQSFTIELKPGGGTTVTLVPEPSSLLLLLGGLAGAIPFIKRRG